MIFLYLFAVARLLQPVRFHLLYCLQAPWLEYVGYDKVKEEQQNNIKLWRSSNYRQKSKVNQPLQNAGAGVESTDPVERILRRLASYDVPHEPPKIASVAPIVPNISFSDRDSLFKTLEPCFTTLKQFSQYVEVIVFL